MGLLLDVNSMTPDVVSNTINEVMFNPKYKENAKITQAFLNDHFGGTKGSVFILGEVHNSDQWS